jgi:N-acetyl-anhydromuramyl-L-alanine amidase AmpD
MGLVNSTCGANNTPVYRYADDGTSLKEGGDTAKDLVDGRSVTAFLVKYGTENQSHFTSVNLDQAEFRETQESLLVLDKIAKGGNPNSRSSKGQNLHNMYLTRSYSCEVESLGNMQIQPYMYFELANVPMFHGAYLITEVNHSVAPHNVKTKFKGVRVPRTTVPLVTDSFSTMTISKTEISNNKGEDTDELLREIGADPTAARQGIADGSGRPKKEVLPKPLPSEPIIDDSGIEYYELPDEDKFESAGSYRTDPTNIVLHWTAGYTYDSAYTYDQSQGLGYHFIIHEDGRLVQTQSLDKKVSHAGCKGKTNRCHTMNSKSIGISFVGGMRRGPVSAQGVGNEISGYVRRKQDWFRNNDIVHKEANRQQNPLQQWIAIKNAIKLAVKKYPSIDTITGHLYVSSEKPDPGDSFPWDLLINQLKRDGVNLTLKKEWQSTTSSKGTVWDGSTTPTSLFGGDSTENDKE